MTESQLRAIVLQNTDVIDVKFDTVGFVFVGVTVQARPRWWRFIRRSVLRRLVWVSVTRNLTAGMRVRYVRFGRVTR